mmetsp:Transcript_17614/g.24779  ORF Transcript_17614/g.24779 Transcript_17614/m.24779 type:complete len:149 (-) Transcript_17614:70-516(-)
MSYANLEPHQPRVVVHSSSIVLKNIGQAASFFTVPLDDVITVDGDGNTSTEGSNDQVSSCSKNQDLKFQDGVDQLFVWFGFIDGHTHGEKTPWSLTEPVPPTIVSQLDSTQCPVRVQPANKDGGGVGGLLLSLVRCRNRSNHTLIASY